MADENELVRNEPDRNGFTRRRFIQAAGSATAAVAAGSAMVAIPLPAKGQEAVTPPARRGIKKYLAAGQTISLDVNGQPKQLSVTPDTTLLEALREQANLTGSKEVCSRGSCGACTMLVDGKSVNSCLTLAIDAVGRKVTTVEGLAAGDKLSPVQAAFVEHDACQCGYCIPGFVVRSHALLAEFPNATGEQVSEGLCGNICRCAAYTRILAAVEAAAKGETKGATL